MHPTAYAFAQKFYATYCGGLPPTAVVVDFGAYDVNGTLRPIFAGHKYIGIDMSAGPNVDIVCSNTETPFDTSSIDVVVSSSCFEHDECFWETFVEMCRIVKPNGYIYINVPSAGPYHGYPGDCWRFYKDSWVALQKWALKRGLPMDLLYAHIDAGGYWKDNIGVFRKQPVLETIAQGYASHCATPSDIYEHLPTLRRYASEVTHVTECGVRSAISSYAFGDALVGKPGARIVQVDPSSHFNIDRFQDLCAKEGLSATFHKQSDLECPLEETDLLFIDTWHVYGQLKRELARWHPYVKSYIILHDTTVDEWRGETVRNGWDAEAQSRESGIPVEEIRKGLWPAVEEFLQAHTEWRIRERYTNNNGLTILERLDTVDQSMHS